MLGKRRVALCLVFYATVVLASAGPAQVRTDTWIVGNVELVQVPAIVFNNNGAVATDLSKDDFRIVDDGVEQKILHCDRDRVAVSFVVLADVSAANL